MSKCSNCGNQIEEDAKFCSNCGAKFSEEVVATKIAEEGNYTNEKTNAFAIAGFVVGLCGLLVNIFGIVGCVGTILSAIALSQINKTNEKGKGFAIAGLVLGIISIVLGLLGIIALMSLGSIFGYIQSYF